MDKGSGGDGIPGELLQILKDDAVTVLHLTSSCGYTLQLVQLAPTGAGPSPPGQSQGKPLGDGSHAEVNCEDKDTIKTQGQGG